MSNKITREQVIERLKEIRARQIKVMDGRAVDIRSDVEADHIEADQALLDYISDPDIGVLYDVINKWYA